MQSEDTQFEAGMGTTFIVCIPNNQWTWISQGSN
jgi:hypothetical protein